MKKTRKLPKLKAPKLHKLKTPKLGASKKALAAIPGKIPDKLKLRRRPQADEKLVQALQNLPRITNETVAEHREEVLSGARKYIVPLSHSKRRIIIITSALLV